MAILTMARHRFYNNAGAVNAGGKVYTYTAGTSTPVATYTSSSAATPNANPIILDSKGECDLWITGQIKINVLESDDTQVTGWPVDNIGSGVSNNDAQSRWAGTAGGTANALTITPSPSITEYVIGQSFIFKSSANANTAATTIAISGLSTIAVQSNGAACSGGEILASNWYIGVLSTTAIMQISKIGEATLAELGAAAIAGSTTQVFNVEAATADDHAVSRVFGDARYAALAGSASQAFSIASATLAAHALRAGQYGSQISGWTYSNNGTDPTNDIDIAAGSGLDSTRAYFITGSALTKQSDVAWAVGTAAGMLDTGAVGDNDYYLWVIARSDTGVVDYLSSLSSTAPTMPASYDYKRLIGWFKRVGGTIVAFHTYETEGGGLEFAWDNPTQDVNLAATLTTSRRTDAIKVPLNFSVKANITVNCYDGTAAWQIWVGCPDTTDAAVVGMMSGAAASVSGHMDTFEIRTSAAGLIASRSSIATIDTYSVYTNSFVMARRV